MSISIKSDDALRLKQQLPHEEAALVAFIIGYGCPNEDQAYATFIKRIVPFYKMMKTHDSSNKLHLKGKQSYVCTH